MSIRCYDSLFTASGGAIHETFGTSVYSLTFAAIKRKARTLSKIDGWGRGSYHSEDDLSGHSEHPRCETNNEMGSEGIVGERYRQRDVGYPDSRQMAFLYRSEICTLHMLPRFVVVSNNKLMLSQRISMPCLLSTDNLEHRISSPKVRFMSLHQPEAKCAKYQASSSAVRADIEYGRNRLVLLLISQFPMTH